MAKPEKVNRQVGPVAPLPHDGPIMSFQDAASYLRLTKAAVTKLGDGRPDGSDGALGEGLRRWVVRLSPHRRYIRRQPFMEFLHAWANGAVTESEETTPEPVRKGRKSRRGKSKKRRR